MALGTGGGRGEVCRVWHGPERLDSGRMLLRVSSCSRVCGCWFRAAGFPPHRLLAPHHGLLTSQVLLRGLSAPLATPLGALVAVASVVTNIGEYK